MRRCGCFNLLVLCASAATTASAAGQAPGDVVVWYRSAQECPDGASFLRALQARRVRARIASAGDAVAFVVTIGMQAGGRRGVLERQTRGGTVAIRQLDGDDCEQVADAPGLSATPLSSCSNTEQGIEFAANRKWYKLYDDGNGRLQRGKGLDDAGTWFFSEVTMSNYHLILRWDSGGGNGGQPGVGRRRTLRLANCWVRRAESGARPIRPSGQAAEHGRLVGRVTVRRCLRTARRYARYR